MFSQETALAALSSPEYLERHVQSLLGFWITCFPHYQSIAPAEFHPDLIRILEDYSIKSLNVMGFRESAKSTIATLAYPIWAAVNRKVEFIIISSDTDDQARLILENIRVELETNEILIGIYGNLKGNREWGSETIVLANGVRIMARSRGQKFRGLRHRQHRPGIVIVDDPEDRKWVRKKANRDETERWLTGDVIPGMDRHGKIVVLSNMLHTDCIGMRLKRNKAFLTREYNIIENGRCTWPAKYPTKAHLEAVRDRVGRTAWMREYRLKVVPDEGQVVKEEWIVKYKEIPKEFRRMMEITGVDLAISEKQTADYTAMVSLVAGLLKGKPKIYVRSNPVHDRLSLGDTIEKAKLIQHTTPGTTFYVESAGYQQAAIEMFKKAWVNVVGVPPIGNKRARLETVSPRIQDGTVEFAEVGCEDIISEVVNLGIEEHDDLCDAFTYALLAVMQRGIHEKVVKWL